MFLRRDAIVFPQIPKVWSLNLDMLHKKKPSAMQTVFPDLTAPSQMIASRFRKRGRFHQVAASSWRLLNFW